MATRTPRTPKTAKTGTTAVQPDAKRTVRRRPTASTAATPVTAPTPQTPATPVTAVTAKTPATARKGKPIAPASAPASRDMPPGAGVSVYGTRELRSGCKGPDVAELQTRLAGFRGTVPDGDFGGGTTLQVTSFQRDFMKMAAPTGVVDRATFLAIDAFADQYPINFDLLRCPCKVCQGFGQQLFKGLYFDGQPKTEAFHRYEYPGIHRLLLWAARAVFVYVPDRQFTFNSGYRCSVDNTNHARNTTNHHGKAVDLDIVLKPGENKMSDMANCDAVRGKIVETAHGQIGWLAANRKSLEPANIAPTWVHYDVRCYDRPYLGDEAFCTSNDALNARLPITC
jgi:hypothetical protein